MKILVFCQYYYPEPFRIPDICEELVRQGNDVTVVTGTPNYPMGEIYQGYENGNKSDEILNGVKVHRCKTRPRKTGAVNRLLNYFSYPFEASKYIKRLYEDYDVVFVYQLSPVMMTEPAVRYKRKFNKKLVLYCLDLWPESLCIGGIKKNSLIYKFFERISKRLYRAADEILITSKSFDCYLMDSFGIESDKITYLPQYAEAQFLNLTQRKPEEYFNLVFAGNIGKAQSVSTIIDAARKLRDEKVRFHIVGDGSELSNVKKKAEGLDNVIFYGRKPMEDMPKYYEMADAMLVTLTDNPVISLTLPGKVQSYMAAGKPIIGAINGETARVLQEAQGGYCGKAEDSQKLVENIKKLSGASNSDEIGMSNRNYYLKHFSKEQFIKKLVHHLNR